MSIVINGSESKRFACICSILCLLASGVKPNGAHQQNVEGATGAHSKHTLINSVQDQTFKQRHPWSPVNIPLFSDWGKSVNPDEVSTTRNFDYPRPAFYRESNWNTLNGLWEFDRNCEANRSDISNCLWEASFNETILVPFPTESSLSGIRATPVSNWVTYRRSIDPKLLVFKNSEFEVSRYILHIEKCDWECHVFVNGEHIGDHAGGYDAFSFDITNHVGIDQAATLSIVAFDPTERGSQARGKQQSTAFDHPEGIYYTATTGIWDTVWIEGLSDAYFPDDGLLLYPDLATGSIEVAGAVKLQREALTMVAGSEKPFYVVLAIYYQQEFLTSNKVLITNSLSDGVFFFNSTVTIPKKHHILPWSASAPHLYHIKAVITQGNQPANSRVSSKSETTRLDHVTCSLGFRDVSLRSSGSNSMTKQFYLNGKRTFQSGVLYQGFWPESLYAHPSTEAMKSDIVSILMLGFNAVRIHVKVESRRWYHLADVLGLMVWQDLPSRFPLSEIDARNRDQWLREVNRIRVMLRNHPSLVQWQLFNEGLGQPEAHQVSQLVKHFMAEEGDRVVDDASGGRCRDKSEFPYTGGCFGQVTDIHHYPGPPATSHIPPALSNGTRTNERSHTTLVLGEYGGVEFDLPGHMWTKRCFGYAQVSNSQDLVVKFQEFAGKLKLLCRDHLLSASIYTQYNDVETECNGLVTYDRTWKCDMVRMSVINKDLIDHCSRESGLSQLE